MDAAPPPLREKRRAGEADGGGERARVGDVEASMAMNTVALREAGGGARIGDVEHTANVTFMRLPDEIIALILELVLRDIGDEGGVASTDVKRWLQLSGVDTRLRRIMKQLVKGDMTADVESYKDDDALRNFFDVVGSFKRANALQVFARAMHMYPRVRDQILLQAAEFLSEYSLTVGSVWTRKTSLMIACEYEFPSLVGFLLGQATARDSARAKALDDMRRMNPGAIVPRQSSLVRRMLRARDNDGQTVFMKAVHERSSANLRLLIASAKKAFGDGAADLLNVPDKNGSTPVIRAVDKRNIESVRLLIENGADVTVKTADGSTLLHDIQILIDLDAVNMIIRSLGELERRRFVNQKDGRGNTALGYVISFGSSGSDSYADVAGALLSAGADTNVLHEVDFGRSVSRVSILAMACLYHGSTIVAQLLDARADVNMVTDGGSLMDTPLIAAVFGKGVDIIKKLLASPNIDVNKPGLTGVTPLEVACMTNKADIVQLLIEARAEVNKVNKKDGETPLHSVVKQDNGDRRIFEMLLSAGARLDVANAKGMTPLMAASKKAKFDMVKLIVEKLKTTYGPEKLKAELVRRSSGPASKTASGWALSDDPSLAKVKIAKFLLDETIIDEAEDELWEVWRKNYQFALELACQLEPGSEREDLILNFWDYTPVSFALLLLAQNRPNVAELKRLVDDLDTNVDATDEDGNTALHFLATSRSTTVELVKVLTDAEANLEIQNIDEDTPLHIVLADGAEAVAKFLVTEGAVLDLADAQGMTPLMLASQNVKFGLVKLIVEELKTTYAPGRLKAELVRESSGPASKTAIGWALDGDHSLATIKIAKFLLDETIIDEADGELWEVWRKNYQNALHFACGSEPGSEREDLILNFTEYMTGHHDLLLLSQNRPDVAELQHLVDLGADVNFADMGGDTALHNLAEDPSTTVEMVKALIDAGAGTDIVNEDGKRAYDIAVETGLGIGILRLLQ
jgi:ankyrin repeat protein